MRIYKKIFVFLIKLNQKILPESVTKATQHIGLKLG